MRRLNEEITTLKARYEGAQEAMGELAKIQKSQNDALEKRLNEIEDRRKQQAAIQYQFEAQQQEARQKAEAEKKKLPPQPGTSSGP